MEMIVDLKIEFHERNSFIEDTVKGFNLNEQLTGPQNAYIDYILGEVHDLAITVQNLPSDQSRLQLTITHPNITGFRKGWEHLSNLINSVTEAFNEYIGQLQLPEKPVQLLLCACEAFCCICNKRGPTSGYEEFSRHLFDWHEEEGPGTTSQSHICSTEGGENKTFCEKLDKKPVQIDTTPQQEAKNPSLKDISQQSKTLDCSLRETTVVVKTEKDVQYKPPSLPIKQEHSSFVESSVLSESSRVPKSGSTKWLQSDHHLSEKSGHKRSDGEKSQTETRTKERHHQISDSSESSESSDSFSDNSSDERHRQYPSRSDKSPSRLGTLGKEIKHEKSDVTKSSKSSSRDKRPVTKSDSIESLDSFSDNSADEIHRQNLSRSDKSPLRLGNSGKEVKHEISDVTKNSKSLSHDKRPVTKSDSAVLSVSKTRKRKHVKRRESTSSSSDCSESSDTSSDRDPKCEKDRRSRYSSGRSKARASTDKDNRKEDGRLENESQTHGHGRKKYSTSSESGKEQDGDKTQSFQSISVIKNTVTINNLNRKYRDQQSLLLREQLQFTSPRRRRRRHRRRRSSHSESHSRRSSRSRKRSRSPSGSRLRSKQSMSPTRSSSNSRRSTSPKRAKRHSPSERLRNRTLSPPKPPTLSVNRQYYTSASKYRIVEKKARSLVQQLCFQNNILCKKTDLESSHGKYVCEISIGTERFIAGGKSREDAQNNAAMKTLLETAYCFSEIPTGILMHIQHEEQKHGLNQGIETPPISHYGEGQPYIPTQTGGFPNPDYQTQPAWHNTTLPADPCTGYHTQPPWYHTNEAISVPSPSCYTDYQQNHLPLESDYATIQQGYATQGPAQVFTQQTQENENKNTSLPSTPPLLPVSKKSKSKRQLITVEPNHDWSTNTTTNTVDTSQRQLIHITKPRQQKQKTLPPSNALEDSMYQLEWERLKVDWETMVENGSALTFINKFVSKNFGGLQLSRNRQFRRFLSVDAPGDCEGLVATLASQNGLRYKKEVEPTRRKTLMHACITIGIEEAYSTAETETEAIQQASYETLINTAYSFKTIPQQLLKFHQRGIAHYVVVGNVYDVLDRTVRELARQNKIVYVERNISTKEINVTKKLQKKAKVLVRLGRDTVVGLGMDYLAAKYDALLTLLHTTTYRFTTRLPENVIPGYSESFINSCTQ